MKLYLILIPCIAIGTLYCAEKNLEINQIVQEALQSPDGINQGTLNLLVEKQKAIMREQFSGLFNTTALNYMDEKQQVPLRIIRNLDPETAELARKHNENLRQQVLQNQQK